MAFTWEELQPEPLVVKHAETYLTADLLWDIITMFERRTTINQIVQILQQRWRGIYTSRAKEYMRHAGVAVSMVPWWEEVSGHGVLTDRRKVHSIIAAYFDRFFRHVWDEGVQFLRQRLCFGISTDETFKLALKCSVKVVSTAGKIEFKNAPYAVHTIFSSTSKLAVGFRFMPSKSNEQKAVLAREIFEAQAACESAVITRFVATDSPIADKSMLVAEHEKAFAGHPLAGQVETGDDLWHVYHRVGRHLTYGCAHLKPSLLAVLKKGTVVGEQPVNCSMRDWQAVCAGKLAHELDVWVSQHRPNPRAEEQVRICQRHIDSMFTFLPFKDLLLMLGTTINEHGNWAYNRKSKSVSHMRPDHTEFLVLYVLFLHSSEAAPKCIEYLHLPEVVRVQAAQLFRRPVFIDFAAVAARDGAPFVLPYSPPMRTYTLDDYEAEFGPARARLRNGAPTEPAAEV